MNWKIEALSRGETITTSERGNSMMPKILSGQLHRLAPSSWEQCNIGDIVFCKVRGRLMTHLVKAKSVRGLLIANNHGHVNGWSKSIFGKVIEILPMV